MEEKRSSSCVCYLAFVCWIALATAGCGSSDDNGELLDWANLRNPVLAVGDRALKDLAVVYEPNARRFYIFSSVRFEVSDPERDRKTPSFYVTADFKTFEEFGDPDLTPPGDGPDSPDVVRLQGQWHMVFQAPTGVKAVADRVVAVGDRAGEAEADGDDSSAASKRRHLLPIARPRPSCLT